MSHLIEEYAKNLGVKISKPIVSKHFWPLAHDSYITICANSNIPSKIYKHYELVLSLLRPYLQANNIKVFQIGSSQSSAIANTDGQFFDLPFKNFAYILSKSKLHIGSDEVYSHYASSIDTPLVSLIGHAYAEVCKPFWSKNQIILEPAWKNKPCFHIEDPDDYINQIKPEDVADAILKQLKINASVKFKTKFVGDFFHQKIIEVVPNFFQPIKGLDQAHVFMRFDFGFDNNCFNQWCHYVGSFSLFLNKYAPINVLSMLLPKLKNISFVIETDDEKCHEEYFSELIKLNIPLTILVKDPNKLGYYRNKYFDFSVDPYMISSKDDLGKDFSFENTHFISSKTIFADNTQYPSKFHFYQKNNVDNKLKLVDNEALLEELTHFYIYEATK